MLIFQAKSDVGSKSASSSGGKNKKKKWSKGKTKEKSNNAVFFDKATADKLVKEAATYKLITTSILVDRLKINGSLARQAMNHLESRGLIKKVCASASMPIYTRATAAAE